MAEENADTPGGIKKEPLPSPLVQTESTDATSEKTTDKWEPLPLMKSHLTCDSDDEKKKILSERRYSEELCSYLLDQVDVEPIYTLRKHFMDKSKSNCLYYTYVLVDPRSHDDGIELDFEAFIRGVFYIGKGKEGRCADHFFKEGLKGKCQDCAKTCVLEDMMIPKHKKCDSPEAPAEIQCADCLGFIEVQNEKFLSHPTSSSEYCDASLQNYTKKCHLCEGDVETRNEAPKVGAIMPHKRKCEGTGKSLYKKKCPKCREKVAVDDEVIKDHKRSCEAVDFILNSGVCLECERPVHIYQKETRTSTKTFVKGDMMRHPKSCSGSRTSPSKLVLDIKDKKINSIWKAGKTPTAVVCSQGDTEKHAKQKEAMMMMAYGGKDNISTNLKESGGYVQGKLVNRQLESVSGLGFIDASEFPQYGVKLLIDAFKTYQCTDKDKPRSVARKPPCVAQIMWPSNPNEDQPRLKVQLQNPQKAHHDDVNDDDEKKEEVEQEGEE